MQQQQKRNFFFISPLIDLRCVFVVVVFVMKGDTWNSMIGTLQPKAMRWSNVTALLIVRTGNRSQSLNTTVHA